MKITKQDLTNTLIRLNNLTGVTQPEYNKKGCYYIAYNHTGASLYRFTGTNGCADNIFGGGSTKKELYYQIQAYIKGILTSRKES